MTKWYGRWKVIRSIGEGAQTHVFLVSDPEDESNVQYVLKRFKNRERLERFRNEVAARQKLDHALIPSVIDCDLDSEQPYLVETYIEGGDLEQRRDLFMDNTTKTLAYFQQICETIDYAHKMTVIHRDIKPGNILYDKETDQFNVSDFGICFVIDRSSDERYTLLDEKVGPRDFIAPELERGRLEVIAPSCDVYSLGKLLYWMFSGKTLFRETYREYKNNLVHLRGDLQLERINKLLDHMITESPDNRIQSVGDVILRIKKIKNLIEREFNIIRSNFHQRCIYCGGGKYDIAAVYYPEKRQTSDPSDEYFLRTREQFREHGIELRNKDRKVWFVYRCNYCGNVQFFNREPNNKSWEDLRYNAE